MPRLRFEIEAEDRGSAEVDKLSRNVDALDRDIDDLSRSMRGQARAADESERSTRNLGLAVGGAVAGVGALAAGFVALTRQQAEYQRLVERSAFVSNRSEQDVEALIRTFELYGIEIDATEDALRTFYDRLGDARADPNIESAQIFREIGLEIDRADVRLEDFLGRIQTLDRQSQIFVIETIIGGEGAAILQAAADANFQGNLEANLQLTLDPEDRQAIIEADQAIERATQQLGMSIDRLIASNSGLIEGFLEGSSQFLTGAAEIAESLPRVAENISSALGDLTRGQFFAPTRRGEGGTPASSSADFFRPRSPSDVPEAATGRRLELEGSATEDVAAEVGRAVADELNRLGIAESQARRDFLDAGLQAAGPGLTLEGERVPVPGLGGVDVGAGAEFQVLFGNMADDLAGIHYEIAQFLPEIANNTLNAVGAAAQFALQPNIVSLVSAGVATAQAVGELLDLGRPRPVGQAEEADFEFLGPGGDRSLASTLGEDYVPSLQLILDLLGDEGLIAEHERLQNIAAEAWADIQAQTDDEAERIRLFDAFMDNEFAPSWSAFGELVVATWNANRDELELTQADIERLDAFVNDELGPTIQAFGVDAVEVWNQMFEGAGSVEEQLNVINQFLNDTLPTGFDNLSERGILSFEKQLEGINLLDLSLRGILELLGDAGLISEYERLQLIAVEAWERIKLQTDDEAERVRLFNEFMNSQFGPSWAAFADQVVETWNRNREGLGLSQAEIEVLDSFINNQLAPDLRQFGEDAVTAWNNWHDENATLETQLGQIESFLGTVLPGGLTALEASAVRAFAAAFVEAGLFNTILERMNETFAAGKIAVDSLAASVNLLSQSIAAIPDRTYTVTEVRRVVSVDDGRGRGAGPTPTQPFTGDPFENDPFGRNRGIATGDPFLDDPFDRDVDVAIDNPFRDDPHGRESEGRRIRQGQAALDPGDMSQQDDQLRREEEERLRRQGFQDGGRFLVDRPSFFLAGERGRELVQITPENAQDAPGGGTVEVNVNIAAVDGQSVEELLRGSGRDAIIEVIRDATSNGESVVSTRGLVDDRQF